LFKIILSRDACHPNAFPSDAAENSQLTNLNKWMFSNKAVAFFHASCNLIHLQIWPSRGVLTIIVTKPVIIPLCLHYQVSLQSKNLKIVLLYIQNTNVLGIWHGSNSKTSHNYPSFHKECTEHYLGIFLLDNWKLISASFGIL
jgi:hypothetical protein